MDKNVPEIRFEGFSDEWEQRKLGDIMEVTSVKRIHQSDWRDEGIRFLRARDIISASKNEEPTEYLYISQDKYDEYSKISGKVRRGDLLVTGVGSIGVPMLIIDDTPIYFKDGNIIWFKNNQSIEGNFFYYSFISTRIQNYIRSVAGIGTVGTYTIQSGKNTPISIPDYNEQCKVGKFIKNIDSTITLQQRKIEALEQLKKGFLQKMFPSGKEKMPQLRFAHFHGKWEECKLEEIAKINPKSILPEKFVYIDLESVVGTSIVSQRTEEKNSAPSRAQRLARKGDIFYQTVRPYQKNNYLYDLPYDNYVFSTGYAQLRPKINSHFLLSSLQQDLFVSKVLNRCTGTSYPAINSTDLSQIKIKVPVNQSEQNQIGAFFNRLENTIALHLRKLDQLQSTKNALLQKMFV